MSDFVEILAKQCDRLLDFTRQAPPAARFDDCGYVQRRNALIPQSARPRGVNRGAADERSSLLTRIATESSVLL
jgi:hypothetical protein